MSDKKSAVPLMNPSLVLQLDKGTEREKSAAAEISRLMALLEECYDFIQACGWWNEFEAAVLQESQDVE
jgi:hypothetical protein